MTPATRPTTRRVRLARGFRLPVDRTYQLRGRISTDALPSDAVDQLVGPRSTRPVTAATPLRACVPLLEVDGVPVSVRVDATVGELTTDATVPFHSCGAPTPLAAGDHRLATAPGWPVEQVWLRDTSAPAARDALPAPPTVTVVERTPTRLELEVGPTDRPSILQTGIAYDPRWTLRVDGTPAGAPILVDGYSAGWRQDASPTSRHLVVTYAPQRTATATRVLSLAVLAVALLLALGAGPPGRARRDRRSVPAVRGDQARAMWATVGSPVLWLLVPGVLWILLGTTGVLLGGALAVWHWWRPPAPRTLLVASVAAFAAVPVLWLAGGVPATAEIVPRLVAVRWLANLAATVALVLLVTGTCRAVLVRPRSEGP